MRASQQRRRRRRCPHRSGTSHQLPPQAQWRRAIARAPSIRSFKNKKADANNSALSAIIECTLNGKGISACVDTGAQATVMSRRAATSLGLLGRADRRHAGRAVGVGSAKIYGRVPDVDLVLGEGRVRTSVAITVLDNCDFDLLLGMDVLRQFHCEISLMDDRLSFFMPNGGQRVDVTFAGHYDAQKERREGHRHDAAEETVRAAAAARAEPDAAAPAPAAAAYDEDDTAPLYGEYGASSSYGGGAAQQYDPDEYVVAEAPDSDYRECGDGDGAPLDGLDDVERWRSMRPAPASAAPATAVRRGGALPPMPPRHNTFKDDTPGRDAGAAAAAAGGAGADESIGDDDYGEEQFGDAHAGEGGGEAEGATLAGW